MLVGAAEGVRSEVIAWFAFDKAPIRAQYSAYRACTRMGTGAGGLPSRFFARWATSQLLCRKAWVQRASHSLALLKATRVTGDVPRLATVRTRHKEGREELGKDNEDI
jgi:hypothetical protein